MAALYRYKLVVEEAAHGQGVIAYIEATQPWAAPCVRELRDVRGHGRARDVAQEKAPRRSLGVRPAPPPPEHRTN
jgi:hypothetical protein